MKKITKTGATFWAALCLALFTLPCLAQWTWEPENDLPAAIGEIDPVFLEGKIYVFGGKFDALNSSDTVWVFEPGTGWTSGGKMPDSLEDVLVEAFNEKLFLFGGHSHPDFVYRREVLRYDPVTHVFDTVGLIPIGRGFSTSCVLNNKVYLIGGDNAQGAWAAVDIFDLDNYTWSIGPSMNTNRTVAYADTLDGKIYVTGGTDGTIAYSKMEMFDPAVGYWQTINAPMHYPRGFHACKNVDGKLFVFGGTTLSEPVINKVEYYDPNIGEWIEFEPMMYAHRKFGVAVLDGYIIYAVGGAGSAGYMATVEKYELLQSGWEYRKSLPTGRAYCTSSAVDGKIYVIGGAYSTTQTSNVVEMYDPQTNVWVTKANLPVPILGASSQTIGGKIYVVGGQSIYLEIPKDKLYVYDPATDTWTEKAPMLTARAHLSTVVVGGKLYALGGATTFPTRVNTVEMYDPVADNWVTVAPMPTARSGFCSEVVEGKIYAFGGVSQNGYFDALEVYDPGTDTWTEKETMPTTRSIFGSGVVNNMIYAYGGAPDGVSAISSIIKYDPQTDQWEPVDTMPEYKTAFASSVVDGCIYGMGGALIPFFFPNMPGPKVSETIIAYCFQTVNIADVKSITPVSLKNYPNPFHSTTRITFTLTERSKVQLDIFDTNGKKVTTLLNEEMYPGQHEAIWDGSGLPAGIYFCRLQTVDFTITKKCVLLN